jgi:drug/metabolite transporter (DMT)-like permease
VELRVKAELALAGAAMVWGVNFVVVKAGLAHITPLAFVAARFLLGALVLTLVWRSSIRRIDRRDVKAGALIGSFLFTGFLFLTAGINQTTASKAAFINSFEAVLPAVLLAVVWRKRASPRLWAGAAAALWGLYLLSVPAQGLAKLSRGDLLVFCGALLFSLHTVYSGFLTPHHEVLTLSLLQVSTTAVLAMLFLPFSAATGIERPWVDPGVPLAAALVASGVGSLSIGITVQMWAQRHTPASHAALYFSLIPVFASIGSYVFLGERMGGRELAGAGSIFAGVLVASLREEPKGLPHAE